MSQFIFKMPDLGEGTVDAEIVAWHTKPGDTVSEDQVIVEVMTDKAAVEVPAPVSGKVVSINGAAGDKIAVGSPLIVFELNGAGAAAKAAEAPAKAAEAPAKAAQSPAQTAPSTAAPAPAAAPLRQGRVMASRRIAGVPTKPVSIWPPWRAPVPADASCAATWSRWRVRRARRLGCAWMAAPRPLRSKSSDCGD